MNVLVLSKSLKEHLFYRVSTYKTCLDTLYCFKSFSFLHKLVLLVRGLQPRAFTKIAYSDQLFEVSWQPPLNDSAVEDYTVFWCRSNNNRDRPYQVKCFSKARIFTTTLLSMHEWRIVHAQILPLRYLQRCTEFKNSEEYFHRKII